MWLGGIPPGVRIADASRVRLGAYLSEGTTVMHEGFVNFNAGTLGSAMIEGRISAGVVVGKWETTGGSSFLGIPYAAPATVRAVCFPPSRASCRPLTLAVC